jgi:hypothetical protein
MHWDAELPSGNFYAIVMLAMRRADTDNLERLKTVFPEIHKELVARYNAPGGCLTEKEWEHLKQMLGEDIGPFQIQPESNHVSDSKE